MNAVIDAAAILTVLLDERGAEVVIPVLHGGTMSAINVSESCSRAVERGSEADEVIGLIRSFEITITPFGVAEARRTANLRPRTRHVGASLGDRACLDLAATLGAPLFTADKRLAELDIGVDIRLIR
jgi:ribonuclease VapC